MTKRVTRFSLTTALLAVMALFTVSASAHAADAVYIMEGRYVGSESGDYSYLILESNGQEVSFFCTPMITEYLDARPPAMPVTITYEKDRQFLEGTNEEVDMLIVTSVFIPDQYAPQYGISIMGSEKPKATP